MEISNYFKTLEDFRKEANFSFSLEQDEVYKIDFPKLQNNKEIYYAEEKVKKFFKQTKFNLSKLDNSKLNNSTFLFLILDKSKELVEYSKETTKKIRQSTNRLEHIHTTMSYFILLSKELDDFIKIIEPLTPKLTNVAENIDLKKATQIKWYGTQAELIELTKALIENGNLKGKQEDIFEAIQENFNIKLNNIDQAITKFNSRNIENETKFLNSLKASLSKYISDKLNRNR